MRPRMKCVLSKITQVHEKAQPHKQMTMANEGSHCDDCEEEEESSSSMTPSKKAQLKLLVLIEGAGGFEDLQLDSVDKYFLSASTQRNLQVYLASQAVSPRGRKDLLVCGHRKKLLYMVQM